MPLELSSHFRERPSLLTDSMQSCKGWTILSESFSHMMNGRGEAQ